MAPKAHLSIATFPNLQDSLEMPQIPCSDVSADKQKGKLGNGSSLVYGLVPSGWMRPLTLESYRQNYEAGGRTLETEIVTVGKHEIYAHLLGCLNPGDMLLREILRVLFEA